MTSTCSAPRCGRLAKARGLCMPHYKRWSRGAPLDAPVRPTSAAGRLWARIEWTADCWHWTGATLANGYGKVSTGSGTSSTTAHRAVYETFVGPIPEGLELDHLCRNRSCVNPAHLEPVTAVENMRRARESRSKEDAA